MNTLRYRVGPAGERGESCGRAVSCGCGPGQLKTSTILPSTADCFPKGAVVSFIDAEIQPHWMSSTRVRWLLSTWGPEGDIDVLLSASARVRADRKGLWFSTLTGRDARMEARKTSVRAGGVAKVGSSWKGARSSQIPLPDGVGDVIISGTA